MKLLKSIGTVNTNTNSMYILLGSIELLMLKFTFGVENVMQLHCPYTDGFNL